MRLGSELLAARTRSRVEVEMVNAAEVGKARPHSIRRLLSVVLLAAALGCAGVIGVYPSLQSLDPVSGLAITAGALFGLVMLAVAQRTKKEISHR